ncbi:MAG: hypothetical protein R3E10_06055 [Gemmatimonadota bacterium]
MSIHDEFERAVGGKRRGLHPVAKLLIGLALFGVFAFTAVAVVAAVVARKVRHEFEDFRSDPELVIAERIVRHSPDLELVSSDQQSHTITFRTRGSGELTTADASEILEGGLSIQTDEGVLRLNLRGGENGGSLVIEKPDGEVVRIDATGEGGDARLSVTTADGEVFRIDAHGHDDHGALVIRSEDGVLRFDAEGADDEGTLTIRTEEGELIRFELDGSDSGARLSIHTPEGTTTLRGMEEGGSVPSWIPDAPRGARERRVYTAEADQGTAGAVRFQVRDALGDVIDHYRDALDDDGFAVKRQAMDVAGRNVQATLLAERDGRSVMVIAAGSDDNTHVFLAWSERD